MASLHNNKGIALITALLFTLISLGMIMALLSIVVQGTRVSAANKAYKSANEAGYGAIDVVSRDILPAIFNGTFDLAYKQNLTDAIGLDLAFPQDALDACFKEKVGSSTTSWASCTAQSKTSLPKESPDMTFNLKATNSSVGFKVYAKIIDTRCGSDMAGQPCSNSDTTGVDYLEAGSGVTSATGSVTPQHLPAYYRIEVQSERAVNPNEKSQLSVLYAY
ncbi:MAG: pilus assembly protein PilX [Desulfuromonadaceae bacterium]|nr:pilus assembly protein PilX [Desulfuromonadaceae bacterium]